MIKGATAFPYSMIGIIYNPNSTGHAPEMAQKLYGRLSARLSDVPITIYKTKRAGHAEDLAYELAATSQEPLIISVSGDGGYHEVVNGALRAAAEHHTRPICAVYGAGNANDHRRTLKENPLSKAITQGKIQNIDLLCMEVSGTNDTTTSRFAHSYIGLGITPAVAVELNRHKLNRLREAVLVAKTFVRFKPFYIKVDGKRHQFDSLVFANIHQMAKVLRLSEGGRPDDGHFEIIELPHQRRINVLFLVARAALFGLGKQPRQKSYEFTVVNDMPAQLDGEITQLNAGEKVRISIAPQTLRTIF
jgi:diacylglycerol kinase (ATP)